MLFKLAPVGRPVEVGVVGVVGGVGTTGAVLIPSVSPLSKNAETAAAAVFTCACRIRGIVDWLRQQGTRPTLGSQKLLLRIAAAGTISIARGCESLHKTHAVQPEVLLLQAIADARHLTRHQSAQVPLFASNHQPHIAGVNYRSHIHRPESGRTHPNPHFGLSQSAHHLCHLHRS